MREEIIVSGRMNEGVDPVLHAWGWEIAIYLFLGGLAAGLIIYTAFYTLTNKEKKYFTATKLTPIFSSLFLIFGLLALFIDLHHKLFFWQLYTSINLRSPMSWGAWTLLVITPLIIILSILNLKELVPVVNFSKFKILKLIVIPTSSDVINWQWKYAIVVKVETFLQKNIKEYCVYFGTNENAKPCTDGTHKEKHKKSIAQLDNANGKAYYLKVRVIKTDGTEYEKKGNFKYILDTD